MELKHIKNLICPTCSAAPKSITIDALHSCGEWNEHVAFLCGLILHYVPNFHRVMEEGRCSNTPEGKEEQERNRIVYDIRHNADLKILTTEQLRSIYRTLVNAGAI